MVVFWGSTVLNGQLQALVLEKFHVQSERVFGLLVGQNKWPRLPCPVTLGSGNRCQPDGQKHREAKKYLSLQRSVLRRYASHFLQKETESKS